jgi:methylmalonyl-CoA mutase
MSTNNYLESFDKDTTKAWRARVERELKSKSFEDFLIWKSMEGFEIDSWQNKRPNNLPQLIPGNAPWKIVEPIYATDAQQANLLALQALNSGAEAIWYQKSFLGAASEVVSKDIDQNIARVFIYGGNIIDPYQSLLKTGDILDIKNINTQCILDGNRLRERGANVIDEIALLLTQAIEFGSKTNFDSQPIFITGIGNAFLTEISKLRALRWLWQSILVSEGKTAVNASILAKNLTITYAQNDEHTNILRATSSAMSAVIGGASYVMIEPWDRKWKEQNTFSSRISRNIQNLLKEEARLDKNLNPADGSYLIENLTLEIAKLAWERVQEIEKAGGFTVFAKSGQLNDMLRKSRIDQLGDYESNSSVLLGLNKFPGSPMKPEQEFKNSPYDLLPDFLNIPYHLQNQEL